MADSDSSRAGSNPFLDAPMHVLVFTSAGKPIFSYVEDEDEGFAPLCGVLLVLMSMPSQLPQQGVVSGTTTTTEDLQYIVFGGSSYGIYFHQRGELRYVYATRQSAGGPANAARGLELLQMVEHFVCAVAPTMNTVLQRAPNYDARSLFSPADFCVLRTLIAHHVERIEAAVDAVAVAPIAADVRRRLQHLLQQHYRVGEGHTHMESHLYTFVLSSSGLLAMMGPQQSYDQHRRTPDATVVESSGEPEMMHMCGSLSMRDVRLLQHMAVELQRRQPGEAWIPLCLADFCPASFLWCYCCNLGAHARQSSASLEDGDACRRSPSPSSYTSTSSIMLLQIATDAADFPTLSAHAGEMAAALVHDGSSNSAGSLLQQLEEGGAAHTSLIRASSADVDGDAWRWIVSTSDSSTPNTLPLPLRWVGVVFTTNAAAGRRGLRGHLRSSTTMPSEPAIAQRIALLLRVMSSSSELVLDEDDAWSIAMQRIGPCADATSTTLITVFLPATPREEMLGFLQQAAAGWPCFVTEYAALQEWCCA